MKRAILLALLVLTLAPASAGAAYTGGRLSCRTPGGAKWNFVKGERCKSIPGRIIDTSRDDTSRDDTSRDYTDAQGAEKLINNDNSRDSLVCWGLRALYDYRHPGTVPDSLQRIFGCDRWAQDALYHLTHADH